MLGLGLMGGALFLLFGLVKALALILGDSDLSIAVIGVLSLATSVAAFLLGRWLFKRGKKVLALRQADRALRDTRPPIVYLRSCQDDARAAVAPEASGLQMMVGSASEEEQLAAAFNEIGPFIAIGRPGEKLPELGAARFYVGQEEWQIRIRELVAPARLVGLRVGRTPGFFWEVQHTAGAIDPQNWYCCSYSTAEYEAFRQKARSILPIELPPFRGGPSLGGSALGGVL